MKKFLSFLLSLIIILSLMPMTAFAVELKQVDISITAPKVGDHPSFNVKVGDGYKVNSDSLDIPGGIAWIDVTQQRELKSADMFEEGHEYILGIALKTIDGNTFQYDTDGQNVMAKAYLNSVLTDTVTPSQDRVKGGRSVMIVTKRYVFPKTTYTDTELIDTVEVFSIVPPVVGQTWDRVANVAKDAPYTVFQMTEWYDETDKRYMVNNETFKKGHTYTVNVRLDVKDGYEFNSTATEYKMKGTLNGAEAKLNKDFEYQRWARVVVSYTFPELKEHKEITRVDISDIIEPKIGRQSIARAHYLKYSEGVEGYDATWYENYQSTGASLVRPFTGVFSAGKTYTFEVVLEAKDGYAFARKSTGLPDVVVTFNSVVVGYSIRFDDVGRLVVLEEYDNLGPSKEKIQGVITYKIQEPVLGEKPSFKAENQREDNLYYIDASNQNSTKNGIIWYEGLGDNQRKMTETDTFKANEYYYVAIRVKPIEGYWFDTDSNGDLLVSGAINGNTSIISGNEESLFVGYTFDKLEAPVTKPETPTEPDKSEKTEKPEKEPEKPTETEKPQESEKATFTDVRENEYYYEPVMWAVSEGITSGTGATTFSPDATCSRGQVVTFLHRMIGSPEPAAISNPFTDVKSDAYYYKPVMWAVGSKITGGTSAAKFSPDASCTRAQVVTFLWRTAGQPQPQGQDNPFTDVKTGSYYYDAVLWAVEQGITGGTSATKFSPDASCTRGQVVTFLYRFINGN